MPWPFRMNYELAVVSHYSGVNDVVAGTIRPTEGKCPSEAFSRRTNTGSKIRKHLKISKKNPYGYGLKDWRSFVDNGKKRLKTCDYHYCSMNHYRRCRRRTVVFQGAKHSPVISVIKGVRRLLRPKVVEFEIGSWCSHDFRPHLRTKSEIVKRHLRFEFQSKLNKNTQTCSNDAHVPETCTNSMQLKAAERYMKKLEYQLSKLEELQDQYNIKQNLRQGMKNMVNAYVTSSGWDRDAALNSVKAGYREATETTMCGIESKLEKMMGKFHFTMKVPRRIHGFARSLARSCVPVMFEITIKHSSQKWKENPWSGAEKRNLFWDKICRNFQVKIARSSRSATMMPFFDSNLCSENAKNLQSFSKAKPNYVVRAASLECCSVDPGDADEVSCFLDAVGNLLMCLEDIQGQYPELQQLKQMFRRSRRYSNSSGMSTSIESALECFDFLNTESDVDNLDSVNCDL
uniref:FAM65 N-terminal domain-containing protein n=1 Tax=Strigamia maritima TaxID=126957 RepID=T1J177_STRMM